jgi:hypothetical protein
MTEDALHCDYTDEPPIHTAVGNVLYTILMEAGIHYHE